MLIAQKTHLTTVELDTREVDLATVEQGLLTAQRADRVSHEQTVERIRSLHELGLVVAERLLASWSSSSTVKVHTEMQR